MLKILEANSKFSDGGGRRGLAVFVLLLVEINFYGVQ